MIAFGDGGIGDPDTPTPAGTADTLAFLAGGGELGGLMRAHDWSATPIGPARHWPQSLRIVIRLLLNTRHPMFVFWGPTHVCLYNDACGEVIGPERHPGALGRPGYAVWAEIWDTIGPQIDQVMSGGGATWHRNHLVPITRGGRREDMYWTYSFSPIDEQAASAGIGGVLVVCTETTAQVSAERQQAERAAARTAERDRLAQLFAQAPSFMAMLGGPDHIFELANQAYLRLVGHRAILNRTLAAALPDVVAQGYLDRLDEVFQSGQAFRSKGAKYAAQAVPGGPVDERFVDFIFQPIRDDDGAVTGIFVEGADVTDRALAERQLRELNETLERRVAEEVAARGKTEEVLRQAQKMEAIGQLTGGIAHDFNNMLQAIGGALELMQRRVEQGRTAEVARYVDAACTTVDRAAALTNRLLAFARRQALQPKLVEPDALVEGMAELIRRTVGPSVEVLLRPGDGVWTVLCDPGQLENVLLNLAINARDAMPGDGGRLTISTTDVQLTARQLRGQDGAKPGDYVEVAVADTGTGMTAAVLARAFEPFFTTKPLGQGTGLGLSQLYGFVRQSDGVVKLESSPGQGTTVRLYLPRHLGPAKPDTSDAEPALAATEAFSGTVLVVEDEAEVRAMVAETLRELGCHVLEAHDGPSGLRVLHSREHVDLLVTDVGLPGLNGRQLADAARERRPNLPVLLITGYAGAALTDWQLAPGMEVVSKPFKLDTLAARVGSLLKQ